MRDWGISCAAVALALLAGVAQACVARADTVAPAAPIYAQHLIEAELAAHPEVVVLAIHAVPAGGKENVIVASNIGRIGKLADADDLKVIRTGKPLLAVNKASDRYEVQLVLFDASHRPLGSVGIVFPYQRGADVKKMQATATAIRDHLSRRVSHQKNLTEPYRFDAMTPVGNYSARLVDELFDAHPDLAILCAHTTPLGQPDTAMTISGCSIGRIGKAPDEDDLGVVRTGNERLEINETGDRFEDEMALHDPAGHIIGALGTVYAYKAGDDKVALRARAHAMLAEFEGRVKSASQLLGPADGSGAPPPASPLAIVGHVDLPGYTGDFDHFAVDLPGKRLFLAAEDHGTLEVFNLDTLARMQTVKGPIETPHSILFMPDVKKLLVTETGKSLSHYFNSDTLVYEKPLKLVQGADSIGYDQARGRLYVVTGGKDVPMKDSWLEQVDPRTGRFINHLHFDADHVEAMAIEQHGPRLFINVTDKNYIAILDKASLKELTRWPIAAELGANCCFAFDEAHHRLFVTTRKPAHLLVLDSDTGAEVARFGAPERVDAMEWDAKRSRAYIIGGEGWIEVIEEQDPTHFVERPRLVTPPGTKTSVLVPELDSMFVAASPGESKAMAQVLRVSLGE
jgi:hypothetical protein